MATNFQRNHLFSLILLLFFLLVLPISISILKIKTELGGRATQVLPNFIIRTNVKKGEIENSWCGLSQGGEVNLGNPVSFSEIVKQISILKPCFIRIDHIFDLYAKVDLTSQNELKIDWTKLDVVVNDILKTGAKPFLSLSYMPPAIAKDGVVIEIPKDWGRWQELVKKTVERYSGRDSQNITFVYYEVWNEPDLFGNFTIGGEKDYRLLYKYAALGANQAENTNDFFIGGPAVTHPINTWFTDFLSYLDKENLRIDFLSWHRYTRDPSDLENDYKRINGWLSANKKYAAIPKFISEWGSDSENSDSHDNITDALYTLATATYLADMPVVAFSFEIKDGPSPTKEKFWGRWGLFTNDLYGSTPKPKFQALSFLENFNKGERILVDGQGSSIRAMAVKDGKTYKILAVSYIPKGEALLKTEGVPLTFTGLTKGIYQYSTQRIFGTETFSSTEEITTDRLNKILTVLPNSAYYVTLTKQKDLADFDDGRWGEKNSSLVFDQFVPFLSFTKDNMATKSGTIEFWSKLSLPISSFTDEIFMSAPLKGGRLLVSKKQPNPQGFGTSLVYGIFNKGKEELITRNSISTWKSNEWHHSAFTWEMTGENNLTLRLFIDGVKSGETKGEGIIEPQGNITIGGYQGAIDELRISNIARDPALYFNQPLVLDTATLILRHFNNEVEN